MPSKTMVGVQGPWKQMMGNMGSVIICNHVNQKLFPTVITCLYLLLLISLPHLQTPYSHLQLYDWHVIKLHFVKPFIF
jgi:hypothetical protein